MPTRWRHESNQSVVACFTFEFSKEDGGCRKERERLWINLWPSLMISMVFDYVYDPYCYCYSSANAKNK